jgi:hypothetical protein
MLLYNFLFYNIFRDLSDHFHYSILMNNEVNNVLTLNYIFFFFVIICLCVFCYKKDVGINSKILNYVPFFFIIFLFPVNVVLLPFYNIVLSLLFSLLFFFNFLILKITVILLVYIYHYIITIYDNNIIFFSSPKNIIDFLVILFLTCLSLRFYFDISVLTSFCSDSSNINWSSKKKVTDPSSTASASSFDSKLKEIDEKHPYLKYVLGVAGFLLIVCCAVASMNNNNPGSSGSGGDLGNHPFNPFNQPNRYIVNKRLRPRHNPPSSDVSMEQY